MFYIVALLLCTVLGYAHDAPVVHLDNHYHIHGIQLADTTGARCNAYLGIPFAQPPVGELRWADPKPLAAHKRSHTLFANTLPKQCYQPLPDDRKLLEVYEFLDLAAFDYTANVSFATRAEETSEDCLYLNIFTPDNSETRRPVMVWIHGGAFTSGSSTGYDGRALAISQDVVVVAIQYRLGVFGFLSTGDASASGNWGLKDQTMALRWVKEHISAFGGDPSRVTIFGESAGAVSCGMHAVSSYSAGLFHNAILQSGTEHMRIIYSGTPLQTAQKLAQQARCKANLDSSALIKCLREKSQGEIAAALRGVAEDVTAKIRDGALSAGEAFAFTSFYPTVGNDFFPEHPASSTYSNKVNLIVGFNSDELGHLMAGIFGLADPLSGEGLVSKLEYVAHLLSQGQSEYVSKFLDPLKLVYASSEDSHANMKTAQRAMAHSVFVANAFLKANKHSSNGDKVYMYELLKGLTVLQDESLVDTLLVNGSGLMRKPLHVGADHGDDVPFVFGFPFNPNFELQGYKSTDGDRLLSGMVMQFWGEFARTGSIRGWPEYSSSRRKLLQFDRSEPYAHIANDPIPEVVNLWTESIPAVFREMVGKQTSQAKQDL